MALTLILEKPHTFVGLGTFNYTFPTTGIYNLLVQCTEHISSALVVTVNLNGSPIYTSPTLPGSSGNQRGFEFKIPINATASDALSIVLSSATSIDNQLNNVKSYITVGNGY